MKWAPNRSWSKDEEDLLRRLFKRGESTGDIAKTLRRTYNSVNMHACRLDLKHRPTYQPWTTGEINTLKSEWSFGTPTSKIAEMLGRSEKQVREQVKKFRIARGNKHPWTDPQRRLVEKSLDALIDHLSKSLKRSPSSIRYGVVRAAKSYRVRYDFATTPWEG